MRRDLNGLTSQEAKIRLAKYGPNVLPEEPPPTSLSIFFSQFKNPFVYILLAAGIVTFVLKDIPDTIIIFFVVLVNTVLGFIQEQKATRALQSLKLMIHPKADVVRDGKEIQIGVEDVVPGDIVEIELGDKIPADGKLIMANRLFIAEAVLTGESLPVEKKEGDMVYMGTIVSSGEGYFEVTATGALSEMGKIAASVQ